MGREIDMIGKRFGRLTVVDGPVRRTERWRRANGEFHRNRALFWICKCDCGQTSDPINGDSLRGGLTKSCGCLRQEMARTKRARKLCASTQ